MSLSLGRAKPPLTVAKSRHFKIRKCQRFPFPELFLRPAFETFDLWKTTDAGFLTRPTAAKL